MITTSSIHTVTCDQCGDKQSFNDLGKAHVYDREHRETHTASQLIGKALAGKVWDSRVGPMTWHIGTATRTAREQGYAFMEWNDRVYTIDGFPDHICLARDVPGLTAYRLTVDKRGQ